MGRIPFGIIALALFVGFYRARLIHCGLGVWCEFVVCLCCCHHNGGRNGVGVYLGAIPLF